MRPAANRADFHRFEIVGARHAVGDVPSAVDHPLVGRDVVAHQRQDHHHYVLGHADAVAIGNFRDRDAMLDGRLKVDMIRPDARGDRKLQLFRLRDPFRRQVGWPERLRDDDVRVRQFALEDRGRALFVRGDDQGVAQTLQEFPQSEFARDSSREVRRA